MTTLHDVGGVLGRPWDTFLLGSHNFMVTALGSWVKGPSDPILLKDQNGTISLSGFGFLSKGNAPFRTGSGRVESSRTWRSKGSSGRHVALGFRNQSPPGPRAPLHPTRPVPFQPSPARPRFAKSSEGLPTSGALCSVSVCAPLFLLARTDGYGAAVKKSPICSNSSFAPSIQAGAGSGGSHVDGWRTRRPDTLSSGCHRRSRHWEVQFDNCRCNRFVPREVASGVTSHPPAS